jgi:hypothetical protein
MSATTLGQDLQALIEAVPAPPPSPAPARPRRPLRRARSSSPVAAIYRPELRAAAMAAAKSSSHLATRTRDPVQHMLRQQRDMQQQLRVNAAARDAAAARQASARRAAAAEEDNGPIPPWLQSMAGALNELAGQVDLSTVVVGGGKEGDNSGDRDSNGKRKNNDNSWKWWERN